MLNRYRKWKHVVVPPVLTLALVLMSGEPDESLRWDAGMAIAVVFVAAYLTEEIVWIARNQGRPCDACGQMFKPRAFSLNLRCPHCGRLL